MIVDHTAARRVSICSLSSPAHISIVIVNFHPFFLTSIPFTSEVPFLHLAKFSLSVRIIFDLLIKFSVSYTESITTYTNLFLFTLVYFLLWVYCINTKVYCHVRQYTNWSLYVFCLLLLILIFWSTNRIRCIIQLILWLTLYFTYQLLLVWYYIPMTYIFYH